MPCQAIVPKVRSDVEIPAAPHMSGNDIKSQVAAHPRGTRLHAGGIRFSWRAGRARLNVQKIQISAGKLGSLCIAKPLPPRLIKKRAVTR